MGKTRLKTFVILFPLGMALGWAQYTDADFSKEPQLQQTISLKYPVISLQELCRRLSAQLGVDLQVEKPLQALSATLYVHQQPATEVLTRLATTFRAEWKRIEANNGVRYLLVRQPAVKTEEQQIDALLKLDGLKLLRDALRRLPPRLLEMSPAAVRDEVNNPDSSYASVFLTTKSPTTRSHWKTLRKSCFET